LVTDFFGSLMQDIHGFPNVPNDSTGQQRPSSQIAMTCVGSFGATTTVPSHKEQAMFEDDDQTIFRVVVNHEEQYSIWPEYRELPRGWREIGKSGKRDECLAYIEEVWTDMRPLSLRKKMEVAAKARQEG
jgi:MbtH protein